MFDGRIVLEALGTSGVSHLIWIPDSDLGTWEAAVRGQSKIQLVRVCRESEALVIAAGLLLGGRQPVVAIQCTGLFDAGDALRNVVHDLKLPLFLIVGLRGYYAYQKHATADTCPIFAEPILRAWQISTTLFTDQHNVGDLKKEYDRAWNEQRAAVALIAE
jgi:sulfopyruvate decarboxylase TPP-binding subunit